MFAYVETLLLGYAEKLPLWLFSPLASVVEEVVAPIPSPAVMVVTGSLARIQGWGWEGLVLLAALGAAGKVCGALFLYFVADRAEDLLSSRFARSFGVSHEQIEALGARLSSSWKDYVVLTIIRALPIVPSSLVSLGSGVLKVRLRLYVFATFFGTVARDLVYIYVGYVGTEAARNFVAHSASIESLVQVGILAALVVGLGYAYYHSRRKK